MWRLFHLSNVGRSILIGTPQILCLNSSEIFEKRTRADELLFTMAMRALTHWLKPASFWPAKTSNWWVIRRKALTWHPMTSFYSSISRKKIFVTRRCCCWSVEKPCFGDVPIGVEKVLWQVVWAHAKVHKSCWRKTIKPFLLINIRIFITPEI